MTRATAEKTGSQLVYGNMFRENEFTMRLSENIPPASEMDLLDMVLAAVDEDQELAARDLVHLAVPHAERDKAASRSKRGSIRLPARSGSREREQLLTRSIPGHITRPGFEGHRLMD